MQRKHLKVLLDLFATNQMRPKQAEKKQLRKMRKQRAKRPFIVTFRLLVFFRQLENTPITNTKRPRTMAKKRHPTGIQSIYGLKRLADLELSHSPEKISSNSIKEPQREKEKSQGLKRLECD